MLGYVTDPATPGGLVRRQLPEPEAGPHDAVIKVRAYAINRGGLQLLQQQTHAWTPGQDAAPRAPHRGRFPGVRRARCSGMRNQHGPDVPESSTVGAGVMPAEQQLAAAAQQHLYPRRGTTAITAILAAEHRQPDRGHCRDHLITLPQAARGQTQ